MLEITTDPIDPGALVRAVRTDACGAVVLFAGVVRATSPDDQRPVRRIRYEAYPVLALAQLREITAETRRAFGPLEIAIVHRTGELSLGETSIGIAVAAPHRGPAFDACEYAIDEVKARLAVWKQEVFADGDTAWRANSPGNGSAAAGPPAIGGAAPST